jgi:RNA polymerase sigma-70 factor (ECF subfamily)
MPARRGEEKIFGNRNCHFRNRGNMSSRAMMASAEQPGGFPSTHWSIVDSVGREDSRGERPALEALLKRYLPALRGYLLRRRALQPDRIDDLLQGFVTSKVLESGLIARGDRNRGRFRTLLLTALDHFVVSQIRHDQAVKRGAGKIASLDFEHDFPAPGGAAPSKADAFDVAWARQILRETLVRMQGQCESDGRPDIWGVFESRVLKPELEGAQPPSYSQVVELYGYRSPTQMWNAVRTGKHLFTRILRSVIAEYEGSGDEIEAELQDLRAICARLPQDETRPAYPYPESTSRDAR